MQGPVRQQKFRKNRQPSRQVQESRDRRGNRFATYGRLFEEEMATLLARLQEEGLLTSFVRHEPNSREDSEGKDFTVTRGEGEDAVSRDFGITISLHSWRESKVKHPHVPQFCFPIGTKPDTIKHRILSLFD